MTPRPALALLLVLAACGTPSRRIGEVVPPGTARWALSPYPTPSRSGLSDRVVPYDPRILVVRPPGAEEEAFSVEVDGEGRVRITAGSERAVEWARLVVEQMRAGRWIRVGWVRDRPGFPLRGSKRLLPFEPAYRANLAYEKPFPGVHRVAVLSPGGTLDATPAGVDRAERFFREGHSRGIRRFAIEFDDVGFGLTPASRERFGTYPRALSVYLTACRERLKEIDPGAVLYWLPQTYWTSDPRLPGFARDVREAGGLPADLGLVLTGPEVVSETITAADVERARRAFGLSRRKVLIYDNRGREGDHGPLAGRGADLLAVADAVFGERGEALNRLTRLDYAWNPAAYVPARSHLLACREIVGPAAALPLSRLIREAPRLTRTARRELFREVMEKVRPPARAPVDPQDLLRRIRREVVEGVEP